ncbi:PCNA-interacting partner-like [Littorina saxatilis]|uniref:PCNA-interacting partner n=1 Tax=Littorina saxatilis TaxID=31220 RepID=A0AAN9B6W0_9CAEN
MNAVFVSLHGTKTDGPGCKTMQVSEKEDQSLLQLALQLGRRHGLVKDRATLLSPSDFLQVVQLCLMQAQKKIGKDSKTDVLSNGTVLAVAQALCVHKLQTAIGDVQDLLQKASIKTTPAKPLKMDNTDKTPLKLRLFGLDGENECDTDILSAQILPLYGEFLASSNHIDAVDVLRVFLLELLTPDSELCAELASMRTDITGSPLDPLQELITEKLMELSQKNKEESSESQADPACKTDVVQIIKSFSVSAQEQLTENVEDRSAEDDQSEADLSKELVQELFRSYLNLLLNTRSELAFAHIFNTPDRELTHHAFTHLKHQAKKKKMSLYQTAMSVILKLRLGGHGYAPDPNDKLLEHVKGLGLLTDHMSKLQQVLEDTECVRSSVLRVVNVIKKNLITCKSQRFKQEAVDTVASGIQKDLEHVLADLELNNTLISPDKPACQGGSLTSRRPRRVLLHYLDRCAVTQWGASHSAHHVWLNDVPFGPHTPSRFPCVLTHFRSPAVGCPLTSSNNRLQEIQLKQKKRKLTVGTNLMPDSSDRPLLDRCSERLCDTVIVLPSKTIVHPAESRASLQSKNSDHISAKENLEQTSSPAMKKGRRDANPLASPLAAPLRLGVHNSGQKDKGSKQPSSSQRNKPASKPGKKCRRRLIPPIQGQKSITSFFRV